MIRKNKFNIILGLIFFILMGPFAVETINTAINKYIDIVLLIGFIYCIIKTFQSIPTINIDYNLLNFKVLKLWQLKILIILKCIFLSNILFFITIIKLTNILDEQFIHKIVTLLLINIFVNFICFLKHQFKYKTVINIMGIALSSIVYYCDFQIIIVVCIVLVLIYFISMKNFKYDRIMPYYKSMLCIHEGLGSNDMDMLSGGQSMIARRKAKNTVSLLETKYCIGKNFEFYKEITIAFNNYSIIVNCSLINFVISILSIMNSDITIVKSIALIGITIITDVILVGLNKEEISNKAKGFYIKNSIDDIMKEKYFSHLIIITIPYFSSIFLLKEVNIAIFITIFLIIPIKNIICSFCTKFSNKLVGYILQTILISIYFSIINFLNYYWNFFDS